MKIYLFQYNSHYYTNLMFLQLPHLNSKFHYNCAIYEVQCNSFTYYNEYLLKISSGFVDSSVICAVYIIYKLYI